MLITPPKSDLCDQQKDNKKDKDNDKYIQRTPSKSDLTISAKFHNPGIPGILGLPGV